MTAEHNSLRSPEVERVLDRLHAAARRDVFQFARIAPRLLFGWVRGRSFDDVVTPSALKDVYIPVSREQGKFMYLLARTLGARRIVEFGTSFGISTIYLAAAVRDNGGEVVIGTEIEPSKHERAIANLKEAGLEEFADVRLGDALQTLRDVPDAVDLVLLDGWKDLYMPILELLKPRLRSGSVVLADNIHTFRKALRPYVEHMQSGEHGFQSVTLSIADGFEYSVYTDSASIRRGSEAASSERGSGPGSA